MKVSFALTVFILIVALFCSRQLGHDMENVQREHSVLRERANELGLSTNGVAATRSTQVLPSRDSFSENNTELITSYLKKIVGISQRLEEFSEAQPSEEFLRETMSFYEELLNLDEGNAKDFILLLGKEKGVPEGTRNEIVKALLLELGKERPLDTLDFMLSQSFVIAAGTYSISLGEKSAATQVLFQLSQSDPNAGLAWLNQNSSKLAPEILPELKASALHGSFFADPLFALKESVTLPKKDFGILLNSFINSDRPTAQSQGQLLAFYFDELNLSADRTTWSASSEESERRIQLGRQILVNSSRDLVQLPAESVEEIIWAADLSANQRSQLAAVVATTSADSADPNYWLSFFQENLQGKARERAIERSLTSWTNADFQSAADWIGEQASGAERDLSVRTFATAVAPHEPVSAAEWATTLPPSAERKQLLQTIYRSWNQQDSTAAANFAQQYSLTVEP